MTKANVGKRRDAATGGDAVGGHAARRDAPGDRAIFQASPVELPDIDIHSL
jgi:hypothetical protein